MFQVPMSKLVNWQLSFTSFLKCIYHNKTHFFHITVTMATSTRPYPFLHPDISSFRFADYSQFLLSRPSRSVHNQSHLSRPSRPVCNKATKWDKVRKTVQTDEFDTTLSLRKFVKRVINVIFWGGCLTGFLFQSHEVCAA